MKILILASKSVDDVSGGYGRAFEKLGHEVDFYFDDKKSTYLYIFKVLANLAKLFSRKQSTWLKEQALRYFQLHRRFNSGHYIAIVNKLKPDLILMHGFNGVDGECIRRFNKIGTTAFIAHGDPIVGGAYVENFIEMLKECDHLLFINEAAMHRFGYISDAKLHVLPLAADPQMFYPTEHKKDIDVLMVGNFEAETESTLSKLYIIKALKEVGINIRVFGKGFGGVISTEELNRLYGKSKIVLGPDHPRDQDSPASRVFEATMAGAFVLAEYRPGTKKLFDETVPEFKGDLIEKVRYYLEHDQERAALAKRAHEIATKRHTYDIRAAELLQAVFKTD
jgi:hypothetical protein